MNKGNCEINMFVSVVHNVNPISKNRLKEEKVGKIIGMYDRFVILEIFKSDLKKDKIILGKKLYKESFRYSEIYPLKKPIENIL